MKRNTVSGTMRAVPIWNICICSSYSTAENMLMQNANAVYFFDTDIAFGFDATWITLSLFWDQLSQFSTSGLSHLVWK